MLNVQFSTEMQFMLLFAALVKETTIKYACILLSIEH